MTSPTNVGEVSVDLVAEAAGLARSLRKELEKAFRGIDLSGALRQAVSNTKVQVPAEPDLSGFNAKLSGLYGLGPIRVPVEPDLTGFTERIRAAVARLSGRLTVEVKADVDRGVLGGGIGNAFKGLAAAAPNIGGLTGQVSDLGGALQRAAGNSAQLGGSLAGAAQSATGPVGVVIGLLTTVGIVGAAAFGAVVGGVTLAIPAVTALAGALASLPGLLSGVGAGFGTLALGFKGISEAFEPKTGGGGGGGGQSAAARARQIASAARSVEAARRGVAAANRGLEASERSLAAAERGVVSAHRALADAEAQVAEAQKRAERAQLAVSRARRDAAEDIDDLGRALRGAVISESEAAQAIDDALLALNEAKLTGNIPDIRRAQNAYDRAVLSAEEAADAVGDLQEQADEANTKGVEGSDKVQAALEAEADAYRGVVDAQQGVVAAQEGIIAANDSLKSAQDGVLSAQDGIKSAADGLTSALEAQAAAQEKVGASAGGIGKEVTKLAPNAQKFVNAIKALKPAFEDLRLDVQQRLFAGLDRTVTRIGEKWIPALRVTLGSYADTFNGFFRDLGTAVTTPKFIADIQAGAEGFRVLLEKVGASITSKLVPAFGSLARASAPFLEALGDGLAKIVTRFSDWVLAGEKSGGLTTFFDKAVQALKDIGAIGGTVFSILGSIFEIITGSQSSSGENNPLQTFRDGLQKVADYLDNPKNQKKIIGFVESIRDAINQAGKAANKVLGTFRVVRKIIGGESESLGADIMAGIITGIASMNVFIGRILLSTAKAMVSSYVGWVKGFLGISSPSRVFMEIGRNIIEGLAQGIRNFTGTLRATASTMKTTVVGAVTDAGNWLLDKGRQAGGGIVNGLRSMFPSISATASNIRPTIANPVSRAATSLLYSPGQNIALGLIRGIDSMGARIGRSVASLASRVAASLNRALEVRSPSRVTMWTGRMVGEGLALGIENQAGRVQAAADELATLAVPDVGTADFAGLEATLSRQLSVASRGQLTASWKDSASAHPVVKAFQEFISLEFNGDVQAAFGS
jgi:hypothetical protein